MLEAFSFDQYFFSVIHNQLPELYWFFYAVTNIGNPLPVTLVASLAFVFGKNKFKVFATILLIGLLFSLLITGDIKDIAQSARPSGAYGTNVLYKTSYSFPSGHALSIFVAASILGAYYGWKYRLAGYLIALVVSLSRVYLGVHYPSDIIGGAVIGTIIGEMLAYAAYKYGLCDNMGLLSLFNKPREIQNELQNKTHQNRSLLYVIAFLGAISTTILFSSGYSALVVLVLTTVTLLIIILTSGSGITCDKKLMGAFILMSVGLNSAMSLYFLGSYILSLGIIAMAYIIIMILAIRILPLT